MRQMGEIWERFCSQTEQGFLRVLAYWIKAGKRDTYQKETLTLKNTREANANQTFHVDVIRKLENASLIFVLCILCKY